MINRLLFSKMDRLSSKKISNKHTSCTHTPKWSLNQGNPSEKRSIAFVNMQRKKGHNMLLTPKTNNNNSNAVQLMDCDGLCMISTLQDSLYRISVISMWVLQLPNPSRSLLYMSFFARSNPNMYDRQMGFGIKWQRWGSFQLSDWINSLLIFSERCL